MPLGGSVKPDRFREILTDLDNTASDLWRASSLGPNDALGAQVWFNLGLLAEKRGDDEGAKASFARSIMLRPSGLAKKKLAARPLCGAVVARNVPSEENYRVVRAKNWIDAYQKLYGEGRDAKAGDPPQTNEQARRLDDSKSKTCSSTLAQPRNSYASRVLVAQAPRRSRSMAMS